MDVGFLSNYFSASFEMLFFVLFFVFAFTFFFFFFFLLFRAIPVAYGGSQARGQIGAVAAGLHHRHSNARSKARLHPTPQLVATQDP